MENVKGILTKDEGRVKERIMREIRSIIDVQSIQLLFDFLEEVKRFLPSPINFAK